MVCSKRFERLGSVTQLIFYERMMERIEETCRFLQSQTDKRPQIAIILGSGLGSLADKITDRQAIDYAQIPNFPVSTVVGHSGKLIFGKLGGREVVAMQGRFHYYEGYAMKEVTFPVRVFKAMGVQQLFVSNAAGGLNTSFRVGDMMLINDHINFFPEHPLRGKNDDRMGPRFPDMFAPYSPRLIALAKEIAAEEGLTLREGVYIGGTGPTYETRAEYKLYRLFGADATGMSTVPEVIVAVHGGMEVFGLSLITNMGIGDEAKENSHDEVFDAAQAAQPRMSLLIQRMIEKL